MSSYSDSMCILKQTEKNTRVVVLLKVYGTYFVRLMTGKEGIVENIFKGEDLKEAEEAFEKYISA